MERYPSILVIGDIRWEDLPTGTSLGGWGASFALRLAELGRVVELATVIGKDDEGERALAEVEFRGVRTSLAQRDVMMPTSSAVVRLTEERLPRYDSIRHAAAGQLAQQPGLMGSVDSFEVLYFNSYIQERHVAGTTLQEFLSMSGPSFKIYDVQCDSEIPKLASLEAGLSVASIAHVRAEDLSKLCVLLGLPLVEPEVIAPLFVERFGVSYALITDPFSGGVVSSIVGETARFPSVLTKVIDLAGWHQAFLAGFVHTIQKGSALTSCCSAGVHFADLVAGTRGAMHRCSAEGILAVRERY